MMFLNSKGPRHSWIKDGKDFHSFVVFDVGRIMMELQPLDDHYLLMLANMTLVDVPTFFLVVNTRQVRPFPSPQET